MPDAEDIDSLKRSLRICRAVRAGKLITDPIEAKLLAASRRASDEEAMDLEAHIMRVLNPVPRTVGEISRLLDARFLELATARIETRLEAGAPSGSAFSRSADKATIRAVLERMVQDGNAWSIGWLRKKWGRFPVERLYAPRTSRVQDH